MRSILWVLYAGVLLIPTSLYSADESTNVVFELTPKRCVTLRQGQPCFAQVRFNWQATEAVEICLNDPNKEMKCWSLALEGTVLMPQSLLDTTEYVLVDKEGTVLNSATLVVSWVYRSKRSKRRWRLF